MNSVISISNPFNILVLFVYSFLVSVLPPSKVPFRLQLRPSLNNNKKWRLLPIEID